MRVPLEWLKAFVAIRLTPKRLAERLTMAGLEVVAIHEHAGHPVLDLEITPNRPDCLSIIGVAREVAVLTNQRLKSVQGSGFRVQGGPKKQPRAPNPEPRTPVEIHIEDRVGCRRYIGRVIEGVRIGPSPDWMQRRLAACGLRPVVNVVDITNYVLLEQGQPLHAFDLDRLTERRLIVRRARPQEEITTLDGVKRTLRPETLVIADGRSAVVVAGIMGGVGSEVIPQTRNVLLESAEFDPVTVRRAARGLGLGSESSYRFERGVDPEGVERASQRAAALICELAGGTVSHVVSVGGAPRRRAAIRLDPHRASRWLGIALAPPAIRTTLARLSCRVASSGEGGLLGVTAPSFRQDLTQEVDLYEELARVHGYDRIPAASPRWTMQPATDRQDKIPRPWPGHFTQKAASYGMSLPRNFAPRNFYGSFHRAQALRRVCAGLGLTEAVCWSLVSEGQLARCGVGGAGAVRLENPISLAHAFLRPTLLIGLLGVVQRNLAQGASGLRLFELGRVACLSGRQAGPATHGITESLRLGTILSGVWARDWRVNEPCDFLRLKGVVEAVAADWCRASLRLAPAQHPWADPVQSASLLLGGRELGAIGLVAREVLTGWEIEQDVWYAELSVDDVAGASRPLGTVSVPTAFPPVKRDLSVFVETRTPFEALSDAIAEAGGPPVTRVQLIDRYTGPTAPPGRHGLTFSIEYRNPARTLTAEEAGAIHARVAQALVERFGATLR